jgi:uncharacterized lipoprotein YajG
MKPTRMRDICLLALVVAVLHVLAGCGNTDATQASSQPTLAASSDTDMEQVTLRITGMS